MRSTVLIADADRKARDTCCEFFADRGYDIRTAAGGVECLRVLRSFQPGLLILDAGLLWGGIDGVLECIQRDFVRHFTPLVIVTGDERSIVLSNRTGIPQNQCLQKPVRSLALVEGIISAAESQMRSDRPMHNPSGATAHRMTPSTRQWTPLAMEAMTKERVL